jgi:lipopolysaccharide export system permease protein
MRVLQKYLAFEILQAVLFVLIAFLALFAFIDLTAEVQQIGRGSYQLQHALLFVLLGVPGRIYELVPVAALIGTIYALAMLAARSEFTIMRVSGLSTRLAVWMLFKIGMGLTIITFIFGELLAPVSTRAAEKIKLETREQAVSNQFRSGLWTKDVIKNEAGVALGTRFLNVQENRPDGQLRDIKIYEFDLHFRLQTLVVAHSARFQGNNQWVLENVSETRFLSAQPGKALTLVESFEQAIAQQGTLVSNHALSTKSLVSEITPKTISVLFADPERMSAYDLLAYQRYLAENKQDTQRYQIAFWKKLTYPFAAFVMLALALPFAYLHARAGGVSLKIFIGIMIGVGFHLLNSLASTLGILNTWPPLATILAPSLLFLLLATAGLWWVERR